MAKVGDIAREAADLVEGARSSYGDFHEQFAYCSELWSAYLQRPLTPLQVAHMMVLLKMSRAVMGQPNPDNHRDAIGYLIIAEGS